MVIAPKKRIAIYGNCQAPALTRMLELSSNFKRSFAPSPLPGVHSIQLQGQRKFLERVAPKLDVLVYQPISERYRAEEAPIFGTAQLTRLLHSEAIAISFPSLHFLGYQPRSELCGVVTRMVNVICRRDFHQGGRQLLHHRQVLRSYLLGRDIAEAVRAFDWGEDGDEAHAVMQAKRSLEHMRNAEKLNDIDIRTSGFIAENFVDRMLFHTPAHPGGEVLVRVARRILDILAVKVTREEIANMRRVEPLGYVDYPLQRYVRRALSLRFSGSFEFVAYGSSMTTTEMVERYYRLYDRFDPDIWTALEKKFPGLAATRAASRSEAEAYRAGRRALSSGRR